MQHHSLHAPSWRSYLRAVLAVAWRNLLTFARYPMNAVFRVIEPVAWLVPVYFLGRSFAGPAGNTGFAEYAGTSNYMSFILIGTLMSSYISSVFWGMGFSLKSEMDSGVLESNWMAPVPRTLFLVGQTLANLLITTFNSLLTLFLAALLFGFSINGNLLLALAALLPMIIALYGFGFAFASLVLLLRDANTLVDVSNFVVSLLSGSQFPVGVLPRGLLVVSLALPMTYAFDAVRGLLLDGNTLLPVAWEIGILLISMLVMVPLGTWIFRRVEQRCRQLGTLGMH